MNWDWIGYGLRGLHKPVPIILYGSTQWVKHARMLAGEPIMNSHGKCREYPETAGHNTDQSEIGKRAFRNVSRMNLRIQIVLVLCMSLPLSGCLIIPVKEDKVLSGRPITEDQLTFLTLKVTTRQEVIERLGNPNIMIIWQNACVFMYNWKVRGAIGFQCIIPDPTSIVELPKDYILLIQFNQQEQLVRFKRTTLFPSHSYADCLNKWLRKTNAPNPADSNDRKEVFK
jgi:outer membrane protein assembly factor BamE (lipoprotein component of BamABCDE complex)